MGGTGNGNGGSSWGLDRKISLAVVVAVAAQAGGFLYWLGGLSYTVNDHSEKLRQIDTKTIAVQIADINGQINLLTAIAKANDRQFDRIEAAVRTLEARSQQAERRPSP